MAHQLLYSSFLNLPFRLLEPNSNQCIYLISYDMHITDACKGKANLISTTDKAWNPELLASESSAIQVQVYSG